MCGRGADKWVLDEYHVGSHYAAYSLTYSESAGDFGAVALSKSSALPQPTKPGRSSLRAAASVAVFSALTAFVPFDELLETTVVRTSPGLSPLSYGLFWLVVCLHCCGRAEIFAQHQLPATHAATPARTNSPCSAGRFHGRAADFESGAVRAGGRCRHSYAA